MFNHCISDSLDNTILLCALFEVANPTSSSIDEEAAHFIPASAAVSAATSASASVSGIMIFVVRCGVTTAISSACDVVLCRMNEPDVGFGSICSETLVIISVSGTLLLVLYQ